jgi:hypothetical protein
MSWQEHSCSIRNERRSNLHVPGDGSLVCAVSGQLHRQSPKDAWIEDFSGNLSDSRVRDRDGSQIVQPGEAVLQHCR